MKEKEQNDLSQERILLDINLTEVKSKKQLYIVAYNNRTFSVGRMLYDSLNLLKNGENLQTIKHYLKKEFDISVKDSELINLLDQFFEKLRNSKSTYNLHDYIYFKIPILKENAVSFFANKLKFLYNKFIYIALFISSLILSVYFLVLMRSGEIAYERVNGIAISLSIITAVIILGFFHEFGHAAAAKKFKCDAKMIGFGFYIIFPVFYTDVTRIWQIQASKRVVVNLGGIYFQLLINVIVISLYVIIDNPLIESVFLTIFISSITILIYTINPFFRNDGYWVYSDLFGLENLNQQAVNYPVTLFRLIRNKKIKFYEKIKIFIKDLPLSIYSLLYLLIMPLLFIGLIFLTIYNVTQLLNFQYEEMLNEIRSLLKLSFSVFLNIFFIVRIFRKLIIPTIKKYIVV